MLNVVLLVCGALGAWMVVVTIDDVTRTLFERRVDAFAASRTTEPDVVFFGDSITHEGSWSEYFPGLVVVNRGIGGDTVQHLLDRFDKVAALGPRKLFLMIGINNLNNGQSTDETIRQYQLLFDRFDAELPDTAIYVQSVLPTNDEWMFNIDLNDVAKLNSFLASASGNRGYRFIDLDPVFADAHAQLRTAFSNDGIHIAGDGYARWSEFIDSFVREPVPSN